MSHELKSWGRQRMYHFTFNGQKPAPPGMYEILSDRIKNLYKSHQPFFFFDIISQRPKTATPGRRVHLHMHWRLLRLLILGSASFIGSSPTPTWRGESWFCQGAGGVSTKGAGPYSDSDIMDWRSLGTMAWNRSRFTASHPKFSELGWYKNGWFTMFHRWIYMS